MNFNPFAHVKNYAEMIDKIAGFVFFFVLIALWVICVQIPRIGELLTSFKFLIPIKGIVIPIIVFTIAFLYAWLSRTYKFHDRISDLFHIRYNYDRQHILEPTAELAGLPISNELRKLIAENRKDLMYSVFYRYASSTPGKGVVDAHYVTLALDQWVPVWILIEFTLIGVITTLILLIGGAWIASCYTFFASALFLILSRLAQKQCPKYARQQINQIISNDDRQQEIRREFSALQNKGNANKN